MSIMDLQSKKLNFVQEFLRIKSEEIVDKLEKVLKSERKKEYEKDLSPMTNDEFNKIIDDAEADSINGRMTSAEDLKKDIGTWR
jgi:hypothetical protein